MTDERPTPNPPLWLVMMTAAMAGGMGWGIRGQYGHETGAMIAGALVSLVLVFLFCPGNSSIHVIRAAALGTIAMGFGGSITYGQTIGLTHDGALIGNWEALRWGMLGLAIKGGVWIGFAGLFLGLGLGGKRYKPFEMFLLVLGMLTAVLVGWWLFNSPHNPANKQLPFLYFSDHWDWEPGVELKHRPEIWGGLLCALATGILYAALAKGDRLARNLALWGMLGGALGFPLGQALQATNAWNPEFFRESFVGELTQYFNWWNIMETTFGTVMGAVLGLGLWLNRRLVRARYQPPARLVDRPVANGARVPPRVGRVQQARMDRRCVRPWPDDRADPTGDVRTGSLVAVSATVADHPPTDRREDASRSGRPDQPER